VKFFSQNRFTRAWSDFYFSDFCCNRPARTLKRKKGGKISPAAEVRLLTIPGNRKAAVVRSSLPGCFS
jgi:hypothetical protein